MITNDQNTNFGHPYPKHFYPFFGYIEGYIESCEIMKESCSTRWIWNTKPSKQSFIDHDSFSLFGSPHRPCPYAWYHKEIIGDYLSQSHKVWDMMRKTCNANLPTTCPPPPSLTHNMIIMYYIRLQLLEILRDDAKLHTYIFIILGLQKIAHKHSGKRQFRGQLFDLLCNLN